MRKFILIFLLAVVCVGVGVYFYIYKDHRDIATEEAVFELDASSIKAEFIDNTQQANGKYLDQTVKVKGSVTEVASDSIVVLNDAVVCIITSFGELPAMDTQISVKGRVTGYDDLFEQVKMDQCVVE